MAGCCGVVPAARLLAAAAADQLADWRARFNRRTVATARQERLLLHAVDDRGRLQTASERHGRISRLRVEQGTAAVGQGRPGGLEQPSGPTLRTLQGNVNIDARVFGVQSQGTTTARRRAVATSRAGLVAAYSELITAWLNVPLLTFMAGFLPTFTPHAPPSVKLSVVNPVSVSGA